jgi:hypothetical protein
MARATWKCPHGCGETKECRHLTELIGTAAENSYDNRLSYVPDLSRVEKSIVEAEIPSYYAEEEAEKMRDKIEKFKVLSKKEIDVIVMHLCFNRTFEDIAKTLGYANRGVPKNSFTRSIEKLRKAGYK